MYRIQVKTGRLRRGVIFFNCYSRHAHRGGSVTHYVGKIDAFAVYCPDNEGFYVVPIDAPAVTSALASLRVTAPANNIRKTINWARDYVFDESNPDVLNTRLRVNLVNLEPPMGIEPMAFSLPRKCSTTELRRRWSG